MTDSFINFRVFMGTHLRASGSQCYLSPDASERAPALTPARQASTRFTYPEEMEFQVDLSRLLHVVFLQFQYKL